MPRRVKDRNLDSRDARRKLSASGKPYWRAVGKGLHVGYRKGKTSGVWVIRRYLGDRSYKIETIAEADDVIDADGESVFDFWQAQEVARNLRQTPKRSPYTVKDAVMHYLEYLEGRSSYHDTRKRLEAFVLPVFGDKRVDELDADEIRQWHRSIAKTLARTRTKKGAKQAYRPGDLTEPEIARKRQASANRCLALLKAALNYAWREKKVATNDAWQRVELFRGVDIPRARYLSVSEAQRLINAAQGDFRILVQAALQTGARYQEIARLRVADFNADAGTLHIRKSKVHKSRHIVLTDEGREFFGQLAAGRSSSAPLLGKEWKASWQAPRIQEACKNASIDPPISFHVLRHTWASLSVMAGMPLMVVARNLGHSDTRMVERHYGHLAPSYVADEVRKNAPRFGSARASNLTTLASLRK
ncbi:MAG: tyrosine-type recombinase/integrase [Halobacteriota archaeon]